MGILDNAKDAIIMGLEDYSSGEQKRMILYAKPLFGGSSTV